MGPGQAGAPMIGSECLGCGATQTECDEICGCCRRCDHRGGFDDYDVEDHPNLHGPDDIALPGLEHDTDRAWSKTARGYLAHLARLEYPDGWTFWSVCLSTPVLDRQRGPWKADEVETAFLIRGDQIRRALIVIGTGEVLAHVDENGARP